MKLLIQGCGYIGEVHLKSILNYKLCEVALCEQNEARLQELSSRYGVTETYASLDEALKHPFDGAVICTPNFLHKNDVAKCMQAGLSVLLEKPIAESLAAADEIVALCGQHGRFAFVAYCLRFAAPYQKIKQFVADGTLGQVFGIRASVAGQKAITDAKTDYRTKKSMGGGVISDFSHEIDYALWFAGRPVTAVQAAGGRAVHKDWDVLDTADLLLQCAGDLNISIHMDFLQPYFGRSIEVYGTKGAIRWRDNEPIRLYREEAGVWDDVDASVDWDHVYRDEMAHYLRCLETGERPLVDERGGRSVMALIDACEKAAESGKN